MSKRSLLDVWKSSEHASYSNKSYCPISELQFFAFFQHLNVLEGYINNQNINIKNAKICINLLKVH